MTAGELEQLRAERDALLEHDVATWLDRMRSEGSSYREFESSISYRITAPIRWAGILVRTVRSDGLREAAGLTIAAVKKRAGR
jgi:hypothetical protein